MFVGIGRRINWLWVTAWIIIVFCVSGLVGFIFWQCNQPKAIHISSINPLTDPSFARDPSVHEELNIIGLKQFNMTITNVGSTTVTITEINVDDHSLNYLASRVIVPPNSEVTFSFLYGLPWIAGCNHTISVGTERCHVFNYAYTLATLP